MKTIIIGISGPSASGKSLLANTIVKELGSKQVAVISEDAYYKNNTHLPFEERERINYDHPEAFDHQLLHQHLKDLQAGKEINIPIYDYSNHLRCQQTRHIGRHAIIVLEGILLFTNPIVRNMMDIRIFPNYEKKNIFNKCSWPKDIYKIVQDRIYPCCIAFGLTTIRNDEKLSEDKLGVILDHHWRENLQKLNIEFACKQCWVPV